MRHFKIYNSLTRAKEDFAPTDENHVKLYACGPTVYNVAHIGNARMAVVFDLLARVLRRLYPRVTYVSNITDVDDKIMDAAKASGETIEFITRKFERIYNEDMAALGVILPDIQPRATEHIPEMIILMEKLIARGHAYAAEGHVLFHVPSFPAYGGLSGRSRDDQIAGARVEIAPYKRDPADFVLWKPSTPDQVGWNSPWGRGRPGWHIECSAMSEKHLGLPIDIHGGGADLKFPHHENEIAQSEGAHDHVFVNYWMHNGFVRVDNEKMSKSLGNFFTVREILKLYQPEVVRFFILRAHYRSPLNYSDQHLKDTKLALDRLYIALKDAGSFDTPAIDWNNQHAQKFKAAMEDDFNTPDAIAVLFELANELNKTGAKDGAALLKALGGLLGLLQQNPVDYLQSTSAVVGAASLPHEQIESLIQQRIEARKAGRYAEADEIRKNLQQQGVILEDGPQGTTWRRV